MPKSKKQKRGAEFAPAPDVIESPQSSRLWTITPAFDDVIEVPIYDLGAPLKYLKSVDVPDELVARYYIARSVWAEVNAELGELFAKQQEQTEL